MTTDAAMGGEGGRADVEQERWLLNDQRDFLIRSIADAERELQAGDLSQDDYDVLLQRDRTRLVEAEAALAALGPAADEADAASAERGSETESGSETENAGSPHRRLSTWRRVGIVAACLLIIVGLVILVNHAVNPGLPGQPISGSITESKVQLVEQQLEDAESLNNEGDAVQALQLYDKVLSEDPDDPDALAASGWLEWNYGTAAKSTTLMKAGRRDVERAISLSPSYYAGHLFLGLIVLNQDHNPTGAVAQFTKFLGDSPPQAQLVSVATLVASGYSQAKEPLPATLAKAVATETASSSTTTTTTPPSTP
jgi:tetratricopeptide (TPR) repeat protein